ncbi:MAG TPA: maleylpyruvate isomerase N-terminal domain-containing protein [Thermoanaerobaculia bacterium]|nr:maleylpyruvate isomerase N-terminal domain-containing protein [Thermoanaerobaculia bacterium]
MNGAELPPVLTADLFLPLNEELVALLRGLTPEDWSRPTISRGGWSVREVAAHMLDTQLRRLSFQRDALPPLAPDEPIDGYAGLLAFLNGLNATWITAARRLSPRVVTDLLEVSGRWQSDLFLSLDPFAPALFPVAWAGEAESRVWMDMARDLTEYWHHQQQIRLAAGAPLLLDARFTRPVLETFLRSVPRAYEGLDAAEGTRVRIVLEAPVDGTYSLVRIGGPGGHWRLEPGSPSPWQASVELDPETAWRVFTRGHGREEALRRARIDGDPALGVRLLDSVGMMV